MCTFTSALHIRTTKLKHDLRSCTYIYHCRPALQLSIQLRVAQLVNQTQHIRIAFTAGSLIEQPTHSFLARLEPWAYVACCWLRCSSAAPAEGTLHALCQPPEPICEARTKVRTRSSHPLRIHVAIHLEPNNCF